MSDHIKITIHCKCCGNDFEGRIQKGFYNSYPPDMDGFPHHPAIYNRVILCPACGYATDRIREEVDWLTDSLIHSEKYQEIFTSGLPEISKKEFLNAMVKKEKGLYREAAQSYLCSYWNQRESGVHDGDALAEAIYCFSRHLEENMDVDAAIVLIDCQRQNADFEEAEETARSLLSYVKNQKAVQLVEFERSLIAKKDRTPHSRREADV